MLVLGGLDYIWIPTGKLRALRDALQVLVPQSCCNSSFMLADAKLFSGIHFNPAFVSRRYSSFCASSPLIYVCILVLVVTLKSRWTSLRKSISSYNLLNPPFSLVRFDF